MDLPLRCVAVAPSTPSEAGPFTVDERDKLLRYLWERRRADHPLVFTLFHTGMRPSEAVALRWGDIDTEHGRITIARSAISALKAQPNSGERTHHPCTDGRA